MEINIKPQIITIEVLANPEQVLFDKRLGNHGLIFGILGDVANQYGIKYTYKDGKMICAAPKLRLQKFIEKLHFSSVQYQEV